MTTTFVYRARFDLSDLPTVDFRERKFSPVAVSDEKESDDADDKEDDKEEDDPEDDDFDDGLEHTGLDAEELEEFDEDDFDDDFDDDFEEELDDDLDDDDISEDDLDAAPLIGEEFDGEPGEVDDEKEKVAEEEVDD